MVQSQQQFFTIPNALFSGYMRAVSNVKTIRYIHKDHLGSWNTITDEDGSLLQELSFDAWGNRRNPATWRAFTGTPPDPLFDRGFTGHEHLYAFNLINMNGRVYDPIVGRMLSPDLFIQAPGYSQSLNRYSYCWNNPLKYTDPTGYESGVLYRNDWHWYEYRGGLNSSTNIGPGSGNHWSDAYRDKEGDYMMLSSAAYDKKYGPGAWQNTYSNILIQRNSIFSATGQNATNFLIAINSISSDNLALYFYENIFNKRVAILGTESQDPLLVGSDITGYTSSFGYGVYTGDAGGVTASRIGSGLDKGLYYAGRTNDAIDAFAKTLGTYGLTPLMVKSGKVIGRYSGPAVGVINAGQVFNGVRKDGYQFGYNAQKATAGAVGGIVGAWAGFQAGAWAGFESGFVIGLFFEGVGAIPGAVIGGIAGGLGGAYYGAYGGSKLGESLIINKAP